MLILKSIILLFITNYITFCYAGTGITVHNNYKKEINVKISGSGVGGCDILLQPGESNESDCWCLWGTINYSFCAYEKGIGDMKNSTVKDDIVGNGRCAVVTGEALTCSDVSSLGNCYDGAYSCEIDVGGLCHCKTV